MISVPCRIVQYFVLQQHPVQGTNQPGGNRLARGGLNLRDQAFHHVDKVSGLERLLHNAILLHISLESISEGSRQTYSTGGYSSINLLLPHICSDCNDRQMLG
jgi:hypothetical protein